MSAADKKAKAWFSLKRTYTASIEEVWSLWTTKPGIESWWGPEGFEVTVIALDLKPGGEMLYEMTAVAPQQVAFMKGAGMPLTTRCRIRYVELLPLKRLVYTTLADFIPGVEPYEVSTVVDLQAVGRDVVVSLKFDAMHDELWTQRARAGHESQLRKLDKLFLVKNDEVLQ